VTTGDIAVSSWAWLNALLVIGLVVGLSVLGLWLVWRFVPPRRVAPHQGVAGNLLGVVGGSYGVLAAFVVVTAWSQFSAAHEIVHDEGNALMDAWLTAGAVDVLGPQLRDSLRTYAEEVIATDWAIMGASGDDSDGSRLILRAIFDATIQHGPAAGREELIYPQLLDAIEDIGDARRLRVLASQQRLPPQLWAVLIVGSAITIAFTYFFRTETWGPQLLMTVLLATTIGLNLYVIGSLERPFAGDLLITPRIFEQTLARMGPAPLLPPPAPRGP
jgi:hypothetical protein